LEHWTILQRFWQRALDPDFKADLYDGANGWREEIRVLDSFGIAMEIALQYLYFQRPDPDTFRHWLIQNRKAHVVDDGRMVEDVLTTDDLAFFEKNGFLILKNAVSAQRCHETQKAIWAFLQASPDDPGSWYLDNEEKRGMMVRFFHHPALDANRQSKKIYRAFQQLYVGQEIHKTIDKISFNPPEHKGYRFMGSPLHWDVSLVLPISFRLQGLLYLADCTADDGAFHCVPGFHHRIGEWLSSLPEDANPRELAPQLLTPVAVPGKAGDFVIWHQALPHCATPNRGSFPRMVQYLTYIPQAYNEKSHWI
jgi:hypothetical protein